MVSARTKYRKIRIEMLDNILLKVLNLARLEKKEIEKIPLATLKLILFLVENPYSALSKEKLKKISASERKGSFAHYSKILQAKPQKPQ